MSLDGKVAVVTGAASGIGRASAIRLAQDGADMAVMDLNADGLKETAKLVEETGRKCLPVAFDLLDRQALASAFNQVKQELGFVEILHNNAGGSLREENKPFPAADAAQWDYFIALNLTAAADCTRAVVGEMKERRTGRIINTSSERAFIGGPGMTDYSAAKAGILGFTKSLALELARYQITVNAVCPGITRTPILDRMPDEYLKKSVESVPLQRMAEPEEIAHAVSFFASPGAGYVTGEHLLVAGGRTIH